MQPSVAHTLFTMDNNIAPRDVGWTDSSDSDINSDLLDEELESDLLPSDEDEVPFARHGPVVELDSEDVVAQKEFWNHCAIGFLLDYRKFSVPRLQQLINSTRRVRGAGSIVGRELYFYIFHFEFMEDLMHTCTKEDHG